MIVITKKGIGIESGIILAHRLTGIATIVIGVIESDITETGAGTGTEKGTGKEIGMGERDRETRTEIARIAIDLDQRSGNENENGSEIVFVNMDATARGTVGIAGITGIATIVENAVNGTEAKIGTTSVNDQTVWRNLGLRRSLLRIVRGA